jgi:hypothetical protein
MKKYLLYLLGGAVAAVALLTLNAVPSALAVDGSTKTLSSTNTTVSVATNATQTLTAPIGGTGKSADITLQNTGTHKVYVTLDGTTPTSTRGLVLYPPSTAYNISVSGTNNDVIVTNTWTVIEGDKIVLQDNQQSIKLAVDTAIGAATNKVQVLERYYITYP